MIAKTSDISDAILCYSNGTIYGSEIRLGICGFVALDIYLCVLFLNRSAVYATHLFHALYPSI